MNPVVSSNPKASAPLSQEEPSQLRTLAMVLHANGSMGRAASRKLVALPDGLANSPSPRTASSNAPTGSSR